MQYLVFKYSKSYKICKIFIDKKGEKKLLRELDAVLFILSIKK